MGDKLTDYCKYLAGKAKQQTVTYQEFADEFGIGAARATSGPLNQVKSWTQKRNLPPLHSIVVRTDTGLAGYTGANQEEIEAVFTYAWEKIFKTLG